MASACFLGCGKGCQPNPPSPPFPPLAPSSRFLSTFFMRSAKLSRANGGGSMTLLPLVPGCCATGVSKRIDMSKWVVGL